MDNIIHQRQNYKSQQAALLPELALALPVALALLFFVYWFFLAVTWRSHLKTAVVLAVDLAQSRGDPVIMGHCSTSGTCNTQGALAALDEYFESGDWDSTLGTISAGATSTGLLVGGVHQQAAIAQTVYNDYINQKLGWAGYTEENAQGEPIPVTVNLRSFPVQTLYAMAYAYEIIRNRIGGSIRFPCDPVEPGCLICSPASQTLLVDLPMQRYAIQCSMQPADIFLTPIFTLLGGLGAEPNIMTFSSIESIDR